MHESPLLLFNNQTNTDTRKNKKQKPIIFVYMYKVFILFFLFVTIYSCRTVTPLTTVSIANTNQQDFWKALNLLCGKAYEGTVINAPANDTVFKDQRLIMHIRSCRENIIRIPFIVGNNLSRTWVFNRLPNAISLKHDHRHEDGKEDSITQYGGQTANAGSSTLQIFPADQHTINILPAAATNVWWVELLPLKYFTYNLRRVNTDRLFTIRFDLTRPVDIPGAPWGWKD
jgi:hypothetical protein